MSDKCPKCGKDKEWTVVAKGYVCRNTNCTYEDDETDKAMELIKNMYFEEQK